MEKVVFSLIINNTDLNYIIKKLINNLIPYLDL